MRLEPASERWGVFIVVLLALGVVALAVFLAGCSASLVHGVPNLVQVEPGLFRGGEPTASGWAYLMSQGVDTVVQFDYDSERPKGVLPPAGMRLLRFSMPPADGDDLFRGPTANQLIAAAAALGPHVFGHCLHGEDRTGAVFAVYRHLRQGWSKQDALAEAVHLGFHPELLGLLHAWEEIP